MKLLNRLIVLTCLCLAFATAQADILETGAINQANRGGAERVDPAQRGQLVEQLIAGGVDTPLARRRVAAMTDAQVVELNGKMAALPAGAGVSTTNLLLIIIILVLLL